MKNIIHFAHGNGFPSPCYKQFLDGLSHKYDISYISRVGHNQHYPVTDNWEYLIDEIIASIREQASQPVIAVGHSLGGVLSFMASLKEPLLFKTVIMLDSPIIGPFKSSMIRIAKYLGFIDRLTPASRTKNRKEHWETLEEVMEYLTSRPLFSTFDERCLQDYIEYGLSHDETGFHLRFDRDIESMIYRTMPHTLDSLQGKIPIPTALIYGNKSTVVTALERKYMKKTFEIEGYSIPGTHLFPFEIPELAAKKVIEVLKFHGL